jgi:hypothetical protein
MAGAVFAISAHAAAAMLNATANIAVSIVFIVLSSL